MHSRKLMSNARRRGGVLIAALFAVMTVAVMAACLLQVSGMRARRQGDALERRRAFYLADAAMAEAYTGMLIGKTGDVGTEEKPAKIGGGLFWVRAVALEESRVQLLSTGMWGRGRVDLAMTVELGETSVASLGVFASDPLEIPPGSKITGYDSSAQEGLSDGISPQTLPQSGASFGSGRIGSNADVTIRGTKEQPTTVSAELIPGPRHQAALVGVVTHSGQIEPRTRAAPLPAVEAPFEPVQPGVKHTGRYPLVIPGGDIGLQYLEVGSGAAVIVQGPCNLVVKDLTLVAGASIEFDSRLGTVSIWVENRLNLAEQSMIASTGSDPSQTVVQVVSEAPGLMASSGSFIGVLYAPKAQITIGSKVLFRGALVAKQLVLAPGATFTFDRHLDDVAIDQSLPRFLSWRILELSSSGNVREGTDPYTILGVDEESLMSPAQSHADQLIHVIYKNDAGKALDYEGMESLFDWTDVSEVGELVRNGTQVLFPPTMAETVPPAPASPALDALHATPPLSSKKLKDLLKKISPLTTNEIVAAIAASPGLNSGDLKSVLKENMPLGSTELAAVIDRAAPMKSKELKDVLIEASPLPAAILSRVLLGDTPLSIPDKLAVLKKQ